MTTAYAAPPAVRRLADELYHDTQRPEEVLHTRARVREIAGRVVAPDLTVGGTDPSRP